MATISLPTIKKDTKSLIKDFGYSEKEFICQAVEEKLMELKKLHFFSISEKIRNGLKRKKAKPEDILREVET